MFRNWKRGLYLSLALSTTSICGGCGNDAAVRTELQRELPPAPAELMQPVAVPPLHRGDNPKVKLAQTRDALGVCNMNAVGSRDWYEDLRKSYHDKGP